MQAFLPAPHLQRHDNAGNQASCAACQGVTEVGGEIGCAAHAAQGGSSQALVLGASLLRRRTEAADDGVACEPHDSPAVLDYSLDHLRTDRARGCHQHDAYGQKGACE